MVQVQVQGCMIRRIDRRFLQTGPGLEEFLARVSQKEDIYEEEDLNSRAERIRKY